MTTKHIEGAETIRALKAQVEALTASQNVCGSGAGCLHKDALIEALISDMTSFKDATVKFVADLILAEKERDAALKLAADRLVDAERFSLLCDYDNDMALDALCETLGNRDELTHFVDELIKEAKAAS